jgi:two-component sensor histidine kinase
MVLAAHEHGYPAFLPPANAYMHDFLPNAGPVLLLYFCYLWANRRIVPGGHPMAGETPTATTFSDRAWAFLKCYRWQIVQVIALYIVMCAAFGLAFHYRFRPFPYIRSGSRGVQVLSAAFLLLVFYAAYVSVRETVLAYIEKSGDRREYLVMVSNRVTLFVLRITLLLEVFNLFNFIHDWEGAIAFYALVVCTFLTGMANIYWLFPKYGKEGFFNIPLLARLLLLSFAGALLFYIVFSTQEGQRAIAPFSLLWMFELFIVTPVSWWLYLGRKDHILKLRGMEKALIQSRSSLAFLQSQINPHFLFNVLNTLYGTALQEHADRTAEGIQKLGDMMRFMLHENHLEQIQMSREIEYLQNYISLQKLRTANSAAIVIEDDIDTGHCNRTIAPMLLIPFVENAFKHGISLQEKSWISIKLRCDEQHIFFESRNSVHARPAGDPGKDTPGIGLNNVRERLKWLYPGRYDLEVNGDTNEFRVSLVIRS